MKKQYLILGSVSGIIFLVMTQLLNNTIQHVDVVDTAIELDSTNQSLDIINGKLVKENHSLKKQVNLLNKQVTVLEKLNNDLTNKPKKVKNEKGSINTVSADEKFSFKPIELPDSEDN